MFNTPKDMTILPYEKHENFILKNWVYDSRYSEFFKDSMAFSEEQLSIYAYMQDGYAFIVRKECVPIGFVTLFSHRAVAQTIKFGLMIDEENQGQMNCIHVMSAVAEYVFSKLNIFKMILEVNSENTRLRGIIEKGGFSFEAILKSESKVGNKRIDVARYYITKPEYDLLIERGF